MGYFSEKMLEQDERLIEALVAAGRSEGEAEALVEGSPRLIFILREHECSVEEIAAFLLDEEER
jgi:hypothetical protein